MPALIGHVEALYRYPVKSMAAETLQSATLGWHGLAGDRRLAFRKLNDRGGFPWLSASGLPGLILYQPEPSDEDILTTHVRTPHGDLLPIFADELTDEIAGHFGAPLQMTHMRQGIFDEASVSLIATATMEEIARLAGVKPDARRFRPNILVQLSEPSAFPEENWVGRRLSFGEAANAPFISVTLPDVRCAMVNLDPDTASPTPQVLKSIVRANRNNAGIYATVIRTGRLEIGQPIFLHQAG